MINNCQRRICGRCFADVDGLDAFQIGDDGI
jgi:hypothetical protein